MNLVEPMVASLLFVGAATGSVQLHLLASAADAADTRLQSVLDRVEAELQAAELLLRQRARSGVDGGHSCAAVAQAWAALLAAQPVAEGVQRQQGVEAGVEPPLLRLQVAAPGLPRPRERRYSPAAFAACALEAGDGLP